jgi:hypothetical protein
MGGTTKILDNLIDQNSSFSTSSLGVAGGISCSAANTIIDRNRITKNAIAGASECYGTAIYFDLDNDANWAVVKNNYISGNYHTNGICYGGAIGMYTSSPDIYNNIIANNSADYGGALHAFNNSKPKVINNSIMGNTAIQAGGSLFAENSTSKVFLMNTILWNNNSSGTGHEIDQNTGSSVSAFYCNIQGGWSGEGNIDVNPMFTDTLFNLSESSYCIGNGIASIELNGKTYYCPPTDFWGNPRPNSADTCVDIGAIESPYAGPTSINDKSNELPTEFNLSQNYPNPFNPSTKIKYSIPSSVETHRNAAVQLKVYGILGREVATLVNETKQPGNYEVVFNASNLPTGVYFYKLKAGEFIQTKKMILIK